MSLLKNKKNIPFFFFSFAITVFYVLFSKIILKSDDGHFIGILTESDYNIFEWLKYRYNSISGRSVCEFLTMEFLSANTIFIKIFLSLLWILFIYIMLKIVSAFGDDAAQQNIFVCCIPFLILLTCFNSGAAWYSGAFTYFVPLVFMSVGLSPAVFDLLNIRYKRQIFVPFAFVCAFAACSQEQASALTVTFLLIFICLLLPAKKLKFYHFLPLVSAVAETFFLFSAPGMRKRANIEAGSFEIYNSMRLIKKLLCGFSNYFAFEFLTSIFVSGLFAVLLSFSIKRLYGYKNKICKILLVLWGAVCVVLNGIYIIANHTIPDKGFEKSFKHGTLEFFDAIMITAGILMLLYLIFALSMIIKKEPKTGVALLLCFLAAVCSGTVLGFSSSIYSSGQRVFFFSEVLMLLACAIMLASLKDLSLKKKVSKVVFAFSFVMYLFDCLSFAFMETPIMG